MTIQTVSLGTAPSGAGGDTFRSTGEKMNENFTNWNHAASRQVGTSAGNVMEVGAFGLGGDPGTNISNGTGLTSSAVNISTMMMDYPGLYDYGSAIIHGTQAWKHCIFFPATPDAVPQISSSINNQAWPNFGAFVVIGKNAVVDSSGSIKAASPIIKLFAEKIESNDEAQQQNPVFEKIDVGHYLIKDTEGFAKEGWWIEVPTDSNGNRICAVEYQTLENGDLEIKTFKKKLNEEGDIVANLDAPIDIPSNANGEARWIDIRLHSVPKPTIHKVPRTEKQPRMIQQLKYAMLPSYMTRLTDLIDDQGQVVIVNGKPFQKKETYLVTDAQGIATLTKQPLVNEKGEPVFEWVQAVDAEGNLIFDDVPVLDADGNQIYDEVTYEPQQ